MIIFQVEREKVELAALQEMVGTLEHEIELEIEKNEKEMEEEAKQQSIESSEGGKKLQETSG